MAELSKNLKDVLDKLNKTYGKGTIMTLGDTEPITHNMLSSGSLLIDKVLGGGIGYGRVTEIYGAESSGKTTLCLQFAAECQKTGGRVAYIDVENALDVAYAQHLGVNTDEMIFTQPSSGEQALDIADALAKSGEVNLIIIDSVAALTPQAELDGEMGDMNIGLLARLMSKALRKLTGTLNEKNCAVIFINQIRQKINTGFMMGNPETTTGGNALKFFASQRIELRKTTAIKSGDEVVGTHVKVKCVKNKLAVPMKVCEATMIFGEGFSVKGEAIDLAVDYGFINKSGGWYTTHDGQRVQGLKAVTTYYEEHPDKMEELIGLVKNKLSGIELEPTYEVDPETGEVLEE